MLSKRKKITEIPKRRELRILQHLKLDNLEASFIALREKILRFRIYKYRCFDKLFRQRVKREKHAHPNTWYFSFSD